MSRNSDTNDDRSAGVNGMDGSDSGGIVVSVASSLPLPATAFACQRMSGV